MQKYVKVLKRKTITTFIVISLMCILFSNSVFATTSPNSLDFTNGRGGYTYIWGSNPENLIGSDVYGAVSGSTTQYDGCYTVDAPIYRYTHYVVDYYHFNYTGTTVQAGVVIVNNDSVPVTLYVEKSSCGQAAAGSGQGAETGAKVEKNYQTSSLWTPYTIEGGTCQFIQVQTASPGLVNGKVKFYVSSYNTASSKLRCKVVMIKNGYINSVMSETKVHKATPINNNTSSGVASHDERSITIPLATTTSFNLNAIINKNTNEYENLSGYSGLYYIMGNYGITYDITFTGISTAKNLYITPDWTEILKYAPNTAGIYVDYYNGTAWTYSYIPVNTSISVYLPNGNFKWALPGGSFGNTYFEYR